MADTKDCCQESVAGQLKRSEEHTAPKEHPPGPGCNDKDHGSHVPCNV